MWDDETVEEQTTYRSSMVRITPEEDTTMKIMVAQTLTASNRVAKLTHHHQNKIHSWPKRSWEDNCTLSGYWEINGVNAHCLLDSKWRGADIPQIHMSHRHKDICPRNTKCFTIGMHRQLFHNQLWNECKNQIQSYTAFWILQHN